MDGAGEGPLLTLSNYYGRLDLGGDCLGTEWILTSPFKLLRDKHKVNDKLEFQLLTYKLTGFLKSSYRGSFCISLLYWATLESHNLQRDAPNQDFGQKSLCAFF